MRTALWSAGGGHPDDTQGRGDLIRLHTRKVKLRTVKKKKGGDGGEGGRGATDDTLGKNSVFVQ